MAGGAPAISSGGKMTGCGISHGGPSSDKGTPLCAMRIETKSVGIRKQIHHITVKASKAFKM
jgi:hypothetical protein